MIQTIVDKAKQLALQAHKNQFRKGNGEAYYFHVARVAEACQKEGMGEDAVAAAYLHDVIEDTAITLEEIKVAFGNNIAFSVWGLTNRSSLPENKAKPLDFEWLSRQNNTVQTIKVFDRLDNIRDINQFESGYASLCLRETYKLFENLDKVNPKIMVKAYKGLSEALLSLFPKKSAAP